MTLDGFLLHCFAEWWQGIRTDFRLKLHQVPFKSQISSQKHGSHIRPQVPFESQMSSQQYEFHIRPQVLFKSQISSRKHGSHRSRLSPKSVRRNLDSILDHRSRLSPKSVRTNMDTICDHSCRLSPKFPTPPPSMRPGMKYPVRHQDLTQCRIYIYIYNRCRAVGASCNAAHRMVTGRHVRTNMDPIFDIGAETLGIGPHRQM